MAREIKQRKQKGFSTVELVVALAIILIISAVTLPSFMRIYRLYQLNGAASQMVEILKRTRYEAIRGDRQLSCQTLIVAPATTTAWSNVSGNPAPALTDSQVVFTGPVNLVGAGGVPGTGALGTAVGPGIVLNPVPAGGAVTFDQRGAVTNPAGVNVFYLANNALIGGPSNPGYRAVIVLPSGSVQVWQADAAGNWNLFD